MTEQQTVVGFFDNVAEAQQAVQLLLARGFTPETVTLSTPTGPNRIRADRPAEPDSGSGRFISSLFGDTINDQPRPGGPDGAMDRRRSTLVTVQTQSAGEAKQVAELLDRAGAADLTVEDRQ